MQGRDFLDVAKNLARSQIEASLRSAISRAYYAMLNSAVQFLIQLGFRVAQGPGKHGEVHHRLFNSGIEPALKFSNMLDELRKRRNDADYNMNSAELQNQATCALWVANAELAIILLADCDKEPLRSQIRTGIREYERKIGLHS
jgi:uncharacterized protein (UPF0332 family)